MSSLINKPLWKSDAIRNSNSCNVFFRYFYNSEKKYEKEIAVNMWMWETNRYLIVLIGTIKTNEYGQYMMIR